MNDVYNVVRQAVELLRDLHRGFRANNVCVGADERTCSTFRLIAWSGPWCSCGWLTQLRSHQHVTDVGVAFVCDQWWLTEDLCYFGAILQETPIGLDDFAYMVEGWMVHKIDDRSLLGSCFVVWLKNLFTWDRLDLSGFDYVFRVVYLNEKFSHLLGFFFEVCIARTQAAKSQELRRRDTVFNTGVV